VVDIDFEALTDEELRQLAADTEAEIARRHFLVDVPAQVAALQQQYLMGTGQPQGSPWVQPAGSHDAYPLGWVVAHEGKEWESLIAGNPYEPGVSGWREIVAPGQCPDWVQPTGAHDAYDIGDCVKFLGNCYNSLINANVWSPTAYPQGWQQVPCA
jgi:hypothetical protein